ncbi:putative UPF0481 protein [Iris pallida]|uniref:UPF0481 protein n=1 Tax=Iris pallida TaxID=29817 RepID=A0AAX6I9Z8_IRIPA|nr:putative UPF0481 protein [Iris pallida]
MALKKSYARLSSLFDEQEWVIQIRSTLEGEVAEEDTNTMASIFCVPKELLNCKPEAYAPQVFAFGPYHHWQTHLYDMERYKLAAARRVQALLPDVLRLHQVVQQFMKHEYKIRCHYHKQVS